MQPGGSIDGTNDGGERRPWQDLPRCQSCHTGDAVDFLSVPNLVAGGTKHTADAVNTFDQRGVDGVFHGVSAGTGATGGFLRKAFTGRVQQYAAISFAGVVIIAVLFMIWSLLVGFSDNVLKPLLMGRGSRTPMLVLFMGSLGGFIAGGILGLFIGAVVLSMGYTVFMAWIDGSDTPEGGASSAEAEPESSPEPT